ncbi:MAG: Large-conductance mechanosensitive channel [Microgenomates bacterium OLB23]|nr:MAG: Large-conductance mechanosensitive channel [Microgenomates bacterium OLB23]
MKKAVTNQLEQFFEFVREQGVIGLAIGFILGGAVTKLVAAFVQDIINPLVGIALGAATSLTIHTLPSALQKLCGVTF